MIPARDALYQFAEMHGLRTDQLLGWSVAADFAEWYAEQAALSAPIEVAKTETPLGPEADKQIREDLDNLTIRRT